MKNKMKKWFVLGFSCAFLFGGCGNSQQEEAQNTVVIEKSIAFPGDMYNEGYVIEEVFSEQMIPLASSPVYKTTMYVPEASGTIVYGGNSKSKGVTIDASNTMDGYVMIKCDNGSDKKLKVIIAGPSGVKYTYNLNNAGNFETFILSDGDGLYNIGVYQNVEGTKYSTLFSQKLNVKLIDQFAPFLCPNQYVNYTADSQTVKLTAHLTKDMTDDLEKVQAVYNYVVNNITYDKQKAQTVQSGYLPAVDEVLKEKKGICFDYAALMTSMLRSQNIPTKLVTGYTGSAYHAWISTYTAETGWIEGIIFFDGVSWKLMDPTFASSSNSNDAIMKYIGDGKNYTEKYLY